MKLNGRNVDPIGMTTFLFGFSICGWILFLSHLYYLFVKGNLLPPIWRIYSIIGGFIVWAVANEYFLKNNRYIKISSQYSFKFKRNKMILSLFFMASPYILFLLMGIIKGILNYHTI